MQLIASAKTKDQMEGGFLLNVVVRQCATVLKLLSGEDQTLLVWGNALLVLDLGFHILDGVRRLHIERNGLASKGLYENLHVPR